MSAARPLRPDVPDRPALQQHCRSAIQALDHASGLPGGKVGEPVDEAERATVLLRDGLIDRLRQDGSDASAEYRSSLKQVNAALSLIVGVEYPVGGVHRKLLKLARETLQKVLEGELG